MYIYIEILIYYMIKYSCFFFGKVSIVVYYGVLKELTMLVYLFHMWPINIIKRSTKSILHHNTHTHTHSLQRKV